MMDKIKIGCSGIGCSLPFGSLTTIFIVLKLCGAIEWSWVWVLSPMWLTFAFALAVLGICGLTIAVILLCAALITWIADR